MTPRDTYQDIVRRREDLLPGFSRRQAAAVRHADRWLGPEIQSGRVRVVVDLGCGTGEILLGLAAAWRRRGIALPRLVGVDASPSSIRIARFAAAAVGLTIEFRIEAVAPNSVGRLSSRGHLGVLCLGHTVFHFPQWREVVARLAPKSTIWLVDVYHAWDAAIRAIDMGREWRDEGRSPLGPLVLRSRRDPRLPATIIRELLVRGSPIVRTRQCVASSKELRGAFALAAHNCVHVGTHVAGYGQMQSLVFKRNRAHLACGGDRETMESKLP